MQNIIRSYHVQLHANKQGSLEEIENVLETYKIPRLNHKEIEILNGEVISKRRLNV